jgi:predicted dienelactone hydrolase
MKILNIILTICSYYVFGQNNFHQKTETFIDSVRNNRPINIEIWEPESPPQHPLIILSHGTGGNRLSQAWIAESRVKDGYLVMALDHYGNTFDNPIPPYFVRYWERPLDVQFLLNQLEKDSKWREKIDFDKIGMIGFSLGGYTTLALAGAELDCDTFQKTSLQPENEDLLTIPELGNLASYVQEIDCKNVPNSFLEKRISSFISLAPALGPFAKINQIDGSNVFIMGAEQDKVTPIESNASIFHQVFERSNYEILKGEIGHYIFLNVVDNYPTELNIFFQDAVGINRAQIHQEVLEKIKNHLKKTL